MDAQYNAIPPALLRFVESLSPEQMKYLNELRTPASSPTPISSSSPEAATVSEASSSPNVKTSRVRKTADRLTRAAKRRVELERGAKRPLNAFMAFRAFYSPLLVGMTQKARSGLLKTMWAAETRKNVWALLGKAYSELRDNHNSSVALDKFLNRVASTVPVIPAQHYFQKMGWQLVTLNGDATLERAETFDIASLNNEYPSQTNISSADIVDYCYSIGLVDRSSRIRRSVAAATTLATFASPPNVSKPIEPEISQFSEHPPLPTLEHDIDIGGINPDSEMNAMSTLDSFTFDRINEYQLPMPANPLDLHFHPSIQPPLLNENQAAIMQEDFDPFNIDLNFDIGSYFDFNLPSSQQPGA